MSTQDIDQIKSEWRMYTCNGWVGIHMESGKKLRAGTYLSLLQQCQGWSRMREICPSLYR
jgi:hypothetical protein